MTVDDRLWYWLYLPIANAVEKTSKLVGQLQRGRIAVYLLYSFVTLLVMLWLVQR